MSMISNLFLFFVYNLPLSPNSEKLGSHHLPSIYLFQYAHTVVSESLTQTPLGNNSYQLECGGFVQFLFHLFFPIPLIPTVT